MMTRKDYVKLAAAFRDVPTVSTDTATWNRCLSAVADVLAADNPRFDRERFLDAANDHPKGSDR